jgi:cell division transport system ATP-binding protein
MRSLRQEVEWSVPTSSSPASGVDRGNCGIPDKVHPTPGPNTPRIPGLRSTLSTPPVRGGQRHTSTVDCSLVIRLDRVTKIYAASARPALDDVSMNIEKGEFVFLIGPSGSGKSTFLRLLLKEESPTRGRVHVAGKDLGRLSKWKVPALRRTIGCVFQDFRLLPNKTVAENVGFALEVIGRPAHTIRKVVPEVLELVGLDGKAGRMPNELSGGEQQRVAIARAFVNRPLVLLADEPTGNLDPETSQDIMTLLERINRTGTTVLMATHDNNIVDSMRRRVIELDFGRLVRDQARGVYGVGR